MQRSGWLAWSLCHHCWRTNETLAALSHGFTTSNPFIIVFKRTLFPCIYYYLYRLLLSSQPTLPTLEQGKPLHIATAMFKSRKKKLPSDHPMQVSNPPRGKRKSRSLRMGQGEVGQRWVELLRLLVGGGTNCESCGKKMCVRPLSIDLMRTSGGGTRGRGVCVCRGGP